MTIRIGITNRSSRTKAVDRLKWYAESLQWAGAEPVVLAPDGERSSLDGLDGLLLSGGGDIHPARYGQPLDGTEADGIDHDRDEMEIELTHAALAADLPIFAICRGIQLLNVAMRGGLVQDLGAAHRTPDGATKHHLVWVEPGTRLAEILGRAGQVNTNTHHHQGVPEDALAAGLRVAARALPEEWLIEGVDSPDHRFVVGVQWHPERTYEVPAAHRNLFRAFVDAACS